MFIYVLSLHCKQYFAAVSMLFLFLPNKHDIQILMASAVEAEVGAEAEGWEEDAAGVVMETTTKVLICTSVLHN